jgi:periplasmic protein CpxP/Spy
LTLASRHIFPFVVAGLLVSGAAAQAQPSGASGPRQQDLPQILHLRPDQMAAFHSFQTASQPTPDELGRLRGSSPQVIARLTTPQRLDRFGAYLATQQEMFRRSADATRAFYGQLSPDQQQTFDRVTAPPPNQGRGGPQ